MSTDRQVSNNIPPISNSFEKDASVTPAKHHSLWVKIVLPLSMLIAVFSFIFYKQEATFAILGATTSAILQSPTPTPTPVAHAGICIIRDMYTSAPSATAPDLGKGYAKVKKSGVYTIVDLRSNCSQKDYDELMKLYCAVNKNPIQQQVQTFSTAGTVSSVSCSAQTCNLIECKAIPTNTPSPTTTKVSPIISKIPTPTSKILIPTPTKITTGVSKTPTPTSKSSTPTPTKLPTPTPTPSSLDTDKDGFSNIQENFMGTNPFYACAITTSDDFWPVDVNNDRSINGADVSKLVPYINGTSAYTKRYDLNQDGKITENGDIEIIKKHFLKTCKPILSDSDDDGFNDSIESFIGTDRYTACPFTKSHDAWPPDVNNDRSINGADVSKMVPYINGTNAYTKRYDLNQDGKITEKGDIEIIKKYFLKTCKPSIFNLDSDNDGFGDEIEGLIGTNKERACPLTTTDNAWPPDVNNDTYINGADISKLAPYVKANVSVGGGLENTYLYNARFDLKYDGKINEDDIKVIQQHMLKSCKPS